MGNIKLQDFAKQHGLTQQQLLDKLAAIRVISPYEQDGCSRQGFLKLFFIRDYESIYIYVDWTKEPIEFRLEVTPYGQKHLIKLLNL